MSPSKRKILRGKENIPPGMSSSQPTGRIGRPPANSRIAASYRVSIQANVIHSGRPVRETRQSRRMEAATAIAPAVPAVAPVIPAVAPVVAAVPLAIGTAAPEDPQTAVLGWRETRAQPLLHEDLWVNGQCPTEQDAIFPHQRCGICYMVKSHPVSYVCGHSHCYVCIRLWLERRWTCPVCITPMYRPPFRHFGEEEALACAYPEWKDGSAVEYSWSGLIFPKEPKILVPATP
ncbi:hypothetical protein R3P38DRAFT_3224654 [Favolaschia claudopus]|uniref:RING-type domain-containing protein n=1 Tax=Favolaschia claudopus TaxID=2862362 RepID=A0AAV9ZV19_9AGAR